PPAPAAQALVNPTSPSVSIPIDQEAPSGSHSPSSSDHQSSSVYQGVAAEHLFEVRILQKSQDNNQNRTNTDTRQKSTQEMEVFYQKAYYEISWLESLERRRLWKGLESKVMRECCFVVERDAWLRGKFTLSPLDVLQGFSFFFQMGFTFILATLDGLDVGLLGDVIGEDDCDDDG
ncbi:hypothetical protein Tco_0355335, partial [Tanacetum coccineum]